MRFALRIFFKRTYVKGIENIPATGPAILISNHPSSLMDAAIIGLQTKRPVYFFARGDVFINRLINYVFVKLHMIPVYNHEGEGARKTVGFNEASYSLAETILTKGGLLLFFPEGKSRPGHQLMPLRKGVFRMAFQAAEKNNFSYDIPFIPTGINYEHPVKSNKTVLVNFGKPFLLSSYIEEYKINPRGALLQMTKVGFVEMEKTVLHIRDSKNLELGEACLTILRNEDAVKFANDDQRFIYEKKACDSVNSMDGLTIDRLKTQVSTYVKERDNDRLEDETLSPGFSFPAKKILVLLLGFPFYLTGCLLNFLPVRTGKWITDSKVYREDFYSWIFVTVTAVLYLCWLLILFIGTAIAMSWPTAFGLVLLTVASGYCAVYFRQLIKEYRQFRLLKQISIQRLVTLKDQRNRIVEFFAR